MRHIGSGIHTKFLATLLVLTAMVSMAATYQTKALASRSAAGGSAALKNVGPFEATVYRGPDKGLSLVGELKLQATKSGQLTGMLVPKSGQAIPITGQASGAAIHLIFYLGGGKHVFGVGAIGRDPASMHIFIGGPLVGPNGGDSGDWYSYTDFKNDLKDFAQGFLDGLMAVVA
jgi:hypothetical protein